MNAEVHVVLVQPLYPMNIGAASRAVANMGGRLILIDRQCEVDTRAQRAAAGGQAPLIERTEYTSLEEFYQKEGNGLRIGLSCRTGKMRSPLPLPDICQEIIDKGELPQHENRVYLFFGREDCGLSAEDMKLFHNIAYLPTYGEFSSLNVAQAVLLALYIVQSAFSKKPQMLEPVMGRAERTREDTQQNKKSPSLVFPEQSIKGWIEALGFDIQSQKKVNAYRTLLRILLESRPTPRELNVLEAILQQNTRKLNELKALKEL